MNSSSSVSLPGLLFCLIVLLILPFTSHATDEDPLQDFCVADLNSPISINGFPCKPVAHVTSDDFFLDLSKESNTSNPFRRGFTPGDVFAFPAVNTQGLTLTRIDLGVGGLNPPHTHPRATEGGIILKGKVLVGFVTTNNTLFSKVLTPGMAFIIPRALVHFQLNVGKGKAHFLAFFNSQNPSAIDAVASLFATTPQVPNEVLTKSFLVGEDVIKTIKSAQPANRPAA